LGCPLSTRPALVLAGPSGSQLELPRDRASVPAAQGRAGGL